VGQLFELNFILTSSVMIRRDALESTGGFDESMSHAEDLDLWIRLARRWPAAATARALVRYQHLPSGLTRNIEARLGGNAALYRRLAADTALTPELRRRARQRASMSAFKLAWNSLREGRGSDARAQLASAWLFPERVLPVLIAWTLSLLPAPLLASLRRQTWASRPMATPMLRMPRVVLGAHDATRASGGSS
jgi:GT2 family glycosyltransferase